MQNDNEINMINTVDEKTLKKRLLDTRKKVNNERKNKKKLRIILVSIICSIILLIVSIITFSPHDFWGDSLHKASFHLVFPLG